MKDTSSSNISFAKSLAINVAMRLSVCDTDPDSDGDDEDEEEEELVFSFASMVTSLAFYMKIKTLRESEFLSLEV